ncbi:MAG: glycerol-3-phosphate dehydrogenase/oxidase [Deltaproteobacteria bacterium]|nr:glycerol-3-phosphate dehydrogenase/oxidase [Deltaproteobacteria bacterium]
MDPQYAVIVIGGGVNGAGIFRDASLRGLRCALVEKEDFAAGASGASSGMIHGGARYLAHQPKVTKLACLDSGRIQRLAPHLLFRIPFLFAVPRNRKLARALLLGLDGFFEAYDRYQPLKNGLRHERLTGDEARRVEPGLADDIAGAVVFDEWGIDGHRLCWLNARSGMDAGGTCFTHVRVDAIEPRADAPGWVVRGRGTLDGIPWEATARTVMNAAGAWGPGVAALGGASCRLRPSKGVHLVLDRRVSNYSITASALDGRSIFLEPWQNITILGTTDDDYFGDLDDVPVTQDEVEYLLASIESIYPSIRQCRLIDAWVGVRPTLYRYGPYEDDLSRDHQVLDHGALDGRPGLFSIAGGKLASYRAMSEDAADALARHLGVSRPCRTADEPLPGGDAAADEEALAAQFRLPRHAVRRLAYRHGSLAPQVLAPCSERPARRRALCRCEPVLEAEVRWAARHERARTLADVSRRTRLGTGPCGGIRCALPAALVLAAETGRDAAWARDEARRFLEARYRSRRPVVGGDQVRMEAVIARAAREL